MASNELQTSNATNEGNLSYCHHIVWLDANVNSGGNRGRLRQLRELDPEIKPFASEQECIDYVRQKDDRNITSFIIFIVSGSLSKEVIPKIQNYTCILTMFIFCAHAENYKGVQFPKLQGIYDDTNELISRIDLYMVKNSVQEIDFSFLNRRECTQSESVSSNDQYPVRDLKKDQARFLWFCQWHDFMTRLENGDDEKAKQELIFCCRQVYTDQRSQAAIDRFDKESLDDNAKNAIWWYTQNTFIFQCVNTALRKENISDVYTCRYIIKLLCRQLKDQHKECVRNHKKSRETQFRLYRGGQLLLEDINLINNHTHDLISLNGFVSTTMNRDIAMQFSTRCRKEGFKRVLFEIDVDMSSELKMIFADISELSKYPEEEEFLFSIGTIFRVKSVKYNRANDLYKIRLLLNQCNQLSVIDYIDQTYPTDVNLNDQLVLFGKFLFDMGEYEFAIRYFKDALSCFSDNNDNLYATYLNNLGVCYSEIGKRKQALKYYEKARKIYGKIRNRRGVSACYHNIASIYHIEGEHNDALGHALEASDGRYEYPLEKASTLDLLGRIYLAKRDADAARNNLSDALSIRLRYFRDINPNHPDIGMSYQNLGDLEKKTSSYIEAERNYSRAAEIYRHNYPQSHRLVKNITTCLGDINRR